MLDIHTHHLFSADTESDMFVTSMIFNIIAVGFFFCLSCCVVCVVVADESSDCAHNSSVFH